jgi:hypothetical protein
VQAIQNPIQTAVCSASRTSSSQLTLFAPLHDFKAGFSVLPVVRSDTLSRPAIFPVTMERILAEGRRNIKAYYSQPTYSGKDFTRWQANAQ